MLTSQVVYLGNLRTEATHIRSGNSLTTDAPVDNQGKGEYFSPTDTVATALATCMITTMGIAANAHAIKLVHCRAEVLKKMASDPRRISEVEVTLYFADSGSFTEKEKTILTRAALGCPVAVSLHPDLIQTIKFNWE